MADNNIDNSDSSESSASFNNSFELDVLDGQDDGNDPRLAYRSGTDSLLSDELQRRFGRFLLARARARMLAFQFDQIQNATQARQAIRVQDRALVRWSIRQPPTTQLDNHREYHGNRFEAHLYHFPVDWFENRCEVWKNSMFDCMLPQLHQAPLGSSPRRILDAGAGSGWWALGIHDKYPSAEVIRVDLHPRRFDGPDEVPQNVRFVRDDIETSSIFVSNHYSLIHCRDMAPAIRDWHGFIQRSYNALEPNGWLEIQEFDYIPRCCSVSGQVGLNVFHRLHDFWSLVSYALRRLNVNLNISHTSELFIRMRALGFVNIQRRCLPVPLGSWHPNGDLSRAGSLLLMAHRDQVDSFALGPFTRGLGLSKKYVEATLEKIDQAHTLLSGDSPPAQMFMFLWVMCGQKPEQRSEQKPEKKPGWSGSILFEDQVPSKTFNGPADR